MTSSSIAAQEAYEKDWALMKTSGIHTFTEEHRQKNRQLRQLLLDVLPLPDNNKTSDCDMLYRYLIARHWSVESAHKSIREYLAWRSQERIDTVMWEPVAPKVQEGVATFFGVDKEGYPLLWDQPNPKLVTEVLKAFSKEEMMRAHYKMMESARFLSRSNGVDRITYVLDLTHVTMSSVNTETLSIIKEMSKKDQLFYPEVMRRMLICNGGWVVTAAWKVIRPLLDERVQKKIQFLKEAPSVKALQEYIDAEHVRPLYGGSGSGQTRRGTTLFEQLVHATSGSPGMFVAVPTESSLPQADRLDGQPDGDDCATPFVSLTSTAPERVHNAAGRQSVGRSASESRANELLSSEKEMDPRNQYEDDMLQQPSDDALQATNRTTTTTTATTDDPCYSLSDEDDDGDSLSQTTNSSLNSTLRRGMALGGAPSPRRLPSVSATVTTIGAPAVLRGVRLSASYRRGDDISADLAVLGRGASLCTSESVDNRSRCASAPIGQSSLTVDASPLPQPPQLTTPAAAFQTSLFAATGSGTAAHPKKVITPGRVGDGLAVEIRLEQRGRSIRGIMDGRVIGDIHDNLVVSYRSDAAATAATLPSSASPQTNSFQLLNQHRGESLPRPDGSPTQGRFLVAELLRESGHPLHTHLIVSDANRNALFVIMKRNFHKQLVVHQVVGDAKVHTDKSFKYTVLGEKVKMARCGPRDETTGDGPGVPSTDWVMWGKVRVGSKEVRKYLAERSGSTVLFYDVLAGLPIHDLFALCVGLIELWEE